MKLTTVLVSSVVIVLLLIKHGLATDYPYVIAPRVIRFNHAEDVLVGTFGNRKNQAFKIWLLNSTDVEFSVKTGTVPSKKTPTKTTIQLTENDLIGIQSPKKPHTVKLCATVGGINIPCKDIWIDYKTGFLIVQTDKPVYLPDQKVQVRVAAVDESMNLMQGTQLSFDITSPSNDTIGRKIISLDKSRAFYRHAFDLPPYPELGIWTATVRYKGQYETVGTSKFKVMEYVLPTFEVSVYTNETVLLEQHTHGIEVTVVAKYVYGKPVAGQASIMFNITDKMGDSQTVETAMSLKLNADGSANFNIKLDQILRGIKPFPVNKYLRIQAIVIEEATGHEEESFNDEALFANHLYKFSFERSKTTFHPGFPYYLKVDLMRANGVIELANKDVTITRLNDNKTEPATSNDGKILHVYQESSSSTTVQMKVSITTEHGEEQHSDIFTIRAYEDSKIVHLDTVQIDGDMILKMESNRQSSDTGILLMGITRGKIVKHWFNEFDKNSENIEQLSERLSPRARFVAIYIASNGQLVADAIAEDFPSTCKGAGLAITPSRMENKPKDSTVFTITGDPGMYVGLSGIDKATLALGHDNTLKKDRIFQELRRRDRGCGQGGGLTSGEILKHAGVQVLTTASIQEQDSASVGDPACENKHRNKRAALQHCDGLNTKCCEDGITFAEKVVNDTSDDEKINLQPETKCYGRALIDADDFPQMTVKCLVAFFRACKHKMESLLLDSIQLEGRSVFEEQSEYELDLAKFGLQGITSRKFFPESILFDKEIILDENGHFSQKFQYPDSITSWYLQAIGVGTQGSMCIAEPVETVVFKPFFIQVKLPYRAKRMELFEIETTIFNYNDNGEVTVNVYLSASAGLCYDRGTDKKSRQLTVEIGPNDVKSVKFPVMPLKEGKFKVEVSAIVIRGPNVEFDAVEKELVVEYEGIQMRKSYQICIDYFNNSKDCESSDNVITTYQNSYTQESRIDLTLPPNAIPGSGHATGFIQGSLMGGVIQSLINGTEDAFEEKPRGCGEQTMIYTTPSVYALTYLKATKRMTALAEQKGTDNIRFGINREITLFRHADKSYSCCNARAGSRNQEWFHSQTKPSSVWLTSFVLKVFCQAKDVVDDVLDEADDILPTMKWIIDHERNGMFQEVEYVNVRTMMGEMGNDTRTLTAFVLISLLECNRYQDIIRTTVERSQAYLENIDDDWLNQNPHALAIITYALTLSKSDQITKFRNMLLSKQIKTGGKRKNASEDEAERRRQEAESRRYADLVKSQLKNAKDKEERRILLEKLAEIRRQEAERRRQQEAERRRQQEAERRRQEAERRRQEAERRRLEEEKRKFTPPPPRRDRSVQEGRHHGSIHWESSGTGANAANIETTSYALLALMSFGDMETSGKIVKWLTLHQKSGGGFFSTQATSISLQALSTYAIRISTPDTDIRLELFTQTRLDKSEFHLTSEHDFQIMVDRLPVEKEDNVVSLSAEVKGGYATMKIDVVYNRPATADEICAFNVSDINISDVIDLKLPDKRLTNKRNCDVCGKCVQDNNDINNPEDNSNQGTRRKRSTSDSISKCVRFSVSSIKNSVHGMAIVRVGLQTGVTVEKDDMDELMANNENIFLYESTDSMEGYVVFYLLTLNSTPNDFVFRVKDNYNNTAKSRQPAMVEVYDYYNDEIDCKKMYGIGENKGLTFSHTCEGEECRCLNSVCGTDVRAELLNLISQRVQVKFKLRKYACNSEKADYVAVVSITNVYPVNNTNEKRANGKLLNKFRGLESLSNGDSMVFYWPKHCVFPDLTAGHKYLIIGVRGHQVSLLDNTKELRYPLHGSSLVIEKRQGGDKIKFALNKFQELMIDEGCVD